MNDQHRSWETDMSEAFDRRVRDLHEAPLTLEQVTTRARGIRRRRQAAVAGGVLAVAAVLTPVAVITAGGGGQPDGVPPGATPSRTVTDGTGGTDTPPPDQGQGPVIGRLEGDAFVRGDGVRFVLPGAGYVRADQLGKEIVAYRRDEDTGGGYVDVVTAPAEGGATELVDSIPVVDGYVASPLGLTIAYRTPEGELVTRWDGGETSLGADYPVDALPAAVTGGPDCEEADCVVYLNDGAFEAAPIAVSTDGTTDVAVPDTLKVDDVDDGGLASVQISYTGTGSCSGLYDLAAGDYLFDTCTNTLGAISPSGGHVLAGPAYLDGAGPSSIAILDRRGVQVAGNRQAGGFIGSQAWEDPGHVVYTVYADGAWSVWRLGIDGKVERIADPVLGAEDDPPIQFFG